MAKLGECQVPSWLHKCLNEIKWNYGSAEYGNVLLLDIGHGYEHIHV